MARSKVDHNADGSWRCTIYDERGQYPLAELARSWNRDVRWFLSRAAEFEIFSDGTNFVSGRSLNRYLEQTRVKAAPEAAAPPSPLAAAA